MVEILDLDVTAEAAEEGANIDLDATRVGKSAVIKTSTRQTIFLPLIGLVDHDKLKPGDLIGVNKDSYLILDTLPAEYDNRVKAMRSMRSRRRSTQMLADWTSRSKSWLRQSCGQ